MDTFLDHYELNLKFRMNFRIFWYFVKYIFVCLLGILFLKYFEKLLFFGDILSLIYLRSLYIIIW